MLASVTPGKVDVQRLEERDGERGEREHRGELAPPHALHLPPPGARLPVPMLCASIFIYRGETTSGTRILMTTISMLSFFRVTGALD